MKKASESKSGPNKFLLIVLGLSVLAGLFVYVIAPMVFGGDASQTSAPGTTEVGSGGKPTTTPTQPPGPGGATTQPPGQPPGETTTPLLPGETTTQPPTQPTGVTTTTQPPAAGPTLEDAQAALPPEFQDRSARSDPFAPLVTPS